MCVASEPDSESVIWLFYLRVAFVKIQGDALSLTGRVIDGPVFCLNLKLSNSDSLKIKSQKAYDYQNKPIINLIGWQVYDMASYVNSLIHLIKTICYRSHNFIQSNSLIISATYKSEA